MTALEKSLGVDRRFSVAKSPWSHGTCKLLRPLGDAHTIEDGIRGNRKFSSANPPASVDTPGARQGLLDQKVSPVGLRGAGQHHSGARKVERSFVLAPNTSKQASPNPHIRIQKMLSAPGSIRVINHALSVALQLLLF